MISMKARYNESVRVISSYVCLKKWLSAFMFEFSRVFTIFHFF